MTFFSSSILNCRCIIYANLFPRLYVHTRGRWPANLTANCTFSRDNSFFLQPSLNRGASINYVDKILRILILPCPLLVNVRTVPKKMAPIKNERKRLFIFFCVLYGSVPRYKIFFVVLKSTNISKFIEKVTVKKILETQPYKISTK